MIPANFQENLYNYTVIFINDILSTFRKSKLHEIKKYKNLLKSLLNLSKNEITSKCNNLKKLSENEKTFYTEFQQNFDIADKSKDPDLHYHSVVLFNFSIYLMQWGCM